MITIYKYELKITDRQNVELYAGYEILDVQVQDGKITLWVECNTDAMHVTAKIGIVGTGNPIPFSVNGFVWHIYLV